jgi:uncharacterized protein (TIGR02453 family)
MFTNSFQFLRQLAEHNDREWFHANKTVYNEAKSEFEHATELLLHEVSRFDSTIAGLTPRDCIFRIFRDVRFSHDKSPYKTNFGTFLAPGGRSSMRAGYYLHIQPGESFIAGGIYMPPAPWLKAIRRNIYEHIEEFNEIINHPELKKVFGNISGDKLKKAPLGFPAEFPFIDLLKFKNYGLIKMVSDSEILKEKALMMIISYFKLLQPFIRFLNASEETA